MTLQQCPDPPGVTGSCGTQQPMYVATFHVLRRCHFLASSTADGDCDCDEIVPTFLETSMVRRSLDGRPVCVIFVCWHS